MEDGIKKNENGSWEAPLPFRHHVKDLPSSRGNAMKRLKSTRRTVDKNPIMKEQYFTFMQKIFDNDHAEIVPQEDLRPDKLCWYLPHFDVYQPKKKDKIRVLLDEAAEPNGVSLNKTVEVGEAKFGWDAKSFVDNNFYVDDGLHPAPDSTTAIDLLRRIQAIMLATPFHLQVTLK